MSQIADKYFTAYPLRKAILKSVKEQMGEERAKKVRKLTLQKLDQMITENQTQPLAVQKHTHVRIYPTIAFYQSLQSVMPQEQAMQMIQENFWNMAKENGKKIRSFLKIPFMYRLIPKFAFRKTIKNYGSGASFRHRIVKSTWNVMELDMLRCPYCEACNRYGCSELTDVFCTSDDFAYSNMHPKLIWGRTQTLGRGGTCCDFRIYIKNT